MEIIEYRPLALPRATDGGPDDGDLGSPQSIRGLCEKIEAVGFFTSGMVPMDVDERVFLLRHLETLPMRGFEELAREAAAIADRARLPIGIIRVHSICDESAEVTSALQQTLYRGIVFGVRLFLTSPIVAMRAPLRTGMFCLVLRRSS